MTAIRARLRARAGRYRSRCHRHGLTTVLRVVATVLAAVVLPTAAFRAEAQQPGKPTAVARPPVSTAPSDSEIFADALKAVLDGSLSDKVTEAEAACSRMPRDRTAAARLIALHVAAGKPTEALTAYDRWATAASAEDMLLLGRVAHEFLRALEQAPVGQTRVQALEARARLGDERARQALVERRKATPPTADSWEATVALARLGDAAARREVVDAVHGSTGAARLGALAALRGLPDTPEVIGAIRKAIAEGDPAVKDAAIDAAIGRRADDLKPALREAMDTGRFATPLRAAVALMRLGDPAGRARVEAALASDLPDARLIAAQAFVGSPDTSWIARLEPVLADPNPLMRVLAAELLLPVRPAEARRALNTVLDEQNPVLRAEATRVLALDPAAPLALLRAALRDEAPSVRLHAARALADRAAAAAPAVPSPSRR